MTDAKLPVPGDAVRIHTAAGGCYDNLTGVVKTLEDDTFQALAPERFCDAKWRRVSLEGPASSGGKPVFREIFLPSGLAVL